jgi:hypothetical protein
MQAAEVPIQVYENMTYVPSILDNYVLPGATDSVRGKDPIAIKVFEQSVK